MLGRIWLRENPVLQRELLVNLRTPRSFYLLLIYQVLLSTVVYLAWPKETWLDLTQNPESTRQLVDLFFLGNYVLVSMMTPSFAAGSISGEKERQTYEMLLASPLRPESIVWGKFAAALTHLGILVFSSLPVVMLCLPLGGVSFYEVLAAYIGLICSVIVFGMISVAAGSYFKRTSAALVVSYFLILPLVLVIVTFWYLMSPYGQERVNFMLTLGPGLCIAVTVPLFYTVASRLLHPPDLGGQSGQVLDLEQESASSVGLVISRDQFPDRLFVPPIRKSLMEDNTNPVYDKEMRSEIFGQGTLMLRMAIQISMLLAIVLMAVFLYVYQSLAPWYICYVVLFNVLIGPVFSAGTVTSERERQTLDLLLTTMLSPWKILWGKLLSGLRVSSVLTSFLLWPVMLAVLMVTSYWATLPTIAGYLLIVGLTCLTTSNLALMCSTLFHKTSTSLVAAYALIVLLFLAPVASDYFARMYFPDTVASRVIAETTVISPFSAAHNLPLFVDDFTGRLNRWQRASIGATDAILGYQFNDLRHFGGYLLCTLALNIGVFLVMIWFFHARWRVSSSYR